jgi:hypothetical protein
MNYEELAVEVNEALKTLSRYTFERLTEESIQPDSLYLRKSYNYGVFIMSQSLLDGIITLSERGQARDMSILLRTLQEAWVNAFFSYAGPTHVWVYYLALQSEKSNLKKMENLYRDGLAEEQAYLRKKREYALLRRIITKRYPVLPVIPNVIKQGGDRNIETRSINFRQQCQIIDFYHSGNINGTFVRNYETVYSFLSETVHVSRGINALFSRDEDGRYSVDISGGQNRGQLIIIMINAFLYHYDLMKNYNSSISRSRQLLPAELKQLRRRLIILARQVAGN